MVAECTWFGWMEEEKLDRGGWVGEWRGNGAEWVNELIGWIARWRGK